MNIFNSLGSNYNLNFALKSLFTTGSNQDKISLETLLSKKYDGITILLYKGREAIELALKLLNLPSDSFVAINGFTCFAVYKAIINAGLKTDYIDIEKEDLNFSPQQLKSILGKNPKIKVVMIQNTLGYPTQGEEIAKICKEHNITLIEDLAHSVGTIYQDGQQAGSIGDFTVLSFSQDKIIDAVSGGALIIRNKKFHDKLARLTQLNQKDEIKDKWYPAFTYFIRNTYSFGLGKLTHAILRTLNLLSKPLDNSLTPSTIAPWYCNLVKEEFNNLANSLDHRRKIAFIYSENIDKKILFSKLAINISRSTNLRFPIFTSGRDNLVKFLKKQNIFVSDIWYDAPISPKRYMKQTSYKNKCPNAEKVSSLIINLPTHKNVSEEDAKKISQFINQWLKQK